LRGAVARVNATAVLAHHKEVRTTTARVGLQLARALGRVPLLEFNNSSRRRSRCALLTFDGTAMIGPMVWAVAGSSDILRLVAAAAREIHPGHSPGNLRNRARVIYRGIRYRKLLQRFCDRLARLETVRPVLARPDLLGVIDWPYLNNAWDVAARLDRIATHYELLAASSSKLLTADRNTPLRLFDLSRITPGCGIVVDAAAWFKREGELVLNLFKQDLRVASIAFILGIENGRRAILVGAIQGIHAGVPSAQSLEIYRQLTKDFEGLRPRSLLLEVLRMIGHSLQVGTLLAIADENRHHRHPYFGAAGSSKLGTSYNQIWLEHGGIQSLVPGFYEIPILASRKEPGDIPAKKRAMYRRRYAILAEMEQEISAALAAGGSAQR
jgi:uncharacterized protein VirK/YbjX